jgi:hypothetical protein
MNLSSDLKVIYYSQHPVNETFGIIYESKPSKTMAIVISSTFTIIFTVMCLGAVWYDLYGNNPNRTLMHKITSLVHWTGFCVVPLNHIIELFRYLHGPLHPQLCFGQVVLKNVMRSQILLLLDANIIARYICIFHLKNPMGIQDNFWRILIGMWVLLCSIVLNMTIFLLPGVNFINIFTSSFFCKRFTSSVFEF